jgi:hypothetical protein
MNANLVTDAKFAFVVAEGKPPLVASRFDDAPTKWQFFVANTQKLDPPPAGTQKIHENIWLIPLSIGLPFLTELIECSRGQSVTLRILFLAESPEWITYPIKYPPDAKPAN